MNLGQISIYAFLVLGLAGGVLALALSAVTAVLFRRRGLLMIFFLLGPVLAWLAVASFHKALFTRWHQVQNQFVPAGYPCLLYRPTCNSLRAKYTMTAPEFDAWVQSHPWPLKPSTQMDPCDRQYIGEDFVGEMYATEPAPNGRQLRVYHADGKTYIFYNAF